MLIDFTFGNFRSFREEATLSLAAAENLIASETLNADNTFTISSRSDLRLLKVAAIYGANASGKSNVVKAFTLFRRAVVQSADSSYKFTGYPFWLDTYSNKKPMIFECTFLIESTQYRYGFEVITDLDEGHLNAKGNLTMTSRSLADYRFTSEWLFKATGDIEETLFVRSDDTVEAGAFSEVIIFLEGQRFSRDKSLLLSVANQIPKNTESKKIIDFIDDQFRISAGLNDEGLVQFTNKYIIDSPNADFIRKIMLGADASMQDVQLFQVGSEETENDKTSELSAELSESQSGRSNSLAISDGLIVAELHTVFDPDGRETKEQVAFPMLALGSEGTKKLYAYGGPIADTLFAGRVLFIDEMDARFHPNLTQALIELFQSPETNPKNAQLIFVTHDTNLLDSKLLRRDQIFFVEKDRFSASHMYALSDLQLSNEESSYEGNYIAGRYGAIPFLGGLKRLIGGTMSQNPNKTEEKANAKP